VSGENGSTVQDKLAFLSERAAASTVSLSDDQILAGDSSPIDEFCDNLVPWSKRVFSYDQASDLYGRAERMATEGKSQPDGSSRFADAAETSCAARFGFGDREDALWGWNEYNLGQSLYLIGRDARNVPELELALLAASQANAVFPSSDEGWGWSRYVAGQSAHELWRITGKSAYLEKAVTTLRQIIGVATMPAELQGYASLELSDALIDRYGVDRNRRDLKDAEQLLTDVAEQAQFRSDALAALNSLKAIDREGGS
jgi:hypothetical protein